MNHLAPLDWVIVIFFMLLFVGIGIYYRGNSEGGLADFFLGGRKLPWYIAGVSMVATTFAADTPLWVTEKIAQHGISGNWLWWNMVIGGMLTTFFFARLWRRAEIITELELLEIRYSGKVAYWLRAIRAIYLGLFMNVVIIGWVNAALISILEVFFEIPYQQAFWLTLAAMALVAVYSSIAGLLGIAITDFVQFIIAMSGSIILAVIVLNLPEVGGISGMKAQLPAWRLSFFPSITSASDAVVGTFSLSSGAFFSYIVLQWWASWYPGNEPGGGGYISQRMMSAKDERHAVYSSLFFQIAHYCLRPWPWIIVGLAALILYPDLPIEESRKGFIMAMRDHLPVGLKGLLFVGFISAYMSTISTQLNWGSSYLTNDLYQRFIKPNDSFSSQKKANKHYVFAGRMITIGIMIVAMYATSKITMIDEAAQFLIASGAGLGMVLILRWYWWRINAWSELSATIAPFVGMAISKYILPNYLPESFFVNNGDFMFTVLFTSVVWLVVTFATAPTDTKVLSAFYERIKPGGAWGPYKKEGDKTQALSPLFLSWIFGVLMVYSILFGSGKIIFQEWTEALIWSITAIITGFLMVRFMHRSKFFKD
ncbi:MAG: Na+/proline symporter [Roseivirga sp.]|jgi:Na+/proline symporter